MASKKIAISARVSTSDQSADMQLPDIQRLAGAWGFEVVAVFSESALAVKARSGFDRMSRRPTRGGAASWSCGPWTGCTAA